MKAFAFRGIGTLFVLGGTTGCFAHSVPANREGRTEFDMRLVAEGVATYQARFETPPERFDDVCDRMRRWCRNNLPPAFRAEDAWDEPFEYEIVNGSFRLRSKGPDGALDTDDDLVFDAAAARRGLELLTGCYALTTDNRDLSGTVLQLQSDSLDFNSYVAGPTFDHYMEAHWEPQSADSLRVMWTGFEDGFGLALGRREAGFAGTLTHRWVGGVLDEWEVVALRVDC